MLLFGGRQERRGKPYCLVILRGLGPVHGGVLQQRYELLEFVRAQCTSPNNRCREKFTPRTDHDLDYLDRIDQIYHDLDNLVSHLPL